MAKAVKLNDAARKAYIEQIEALRSQTPHDSVLWEALSYALLCMNLVKKMHTVRFLWGRS